MGTSEALAVTDIETKRFDVAPRDAPAGAPTLAPQPGGDAKAAALFQKAYQKMVALNRVDEQLQAMLTQRRSLQGELKELQGQINGTFQRVLDEASQTPQRLLQEIADQAGADA